MYCANANLTAVLLAASALLCPAQTCSDRTCSAQTNPNPRSLLADIAAARRDARVWHGEGVETDELTGEGMNFHTQIAFKAIFRDPLHSRWEATGDNRTLSVCDGADHWTYAEPGTGFYRTSAAASPCNSQLPAFENLLDNLVSATAVGIDRVPFEGAPRDCDIIRAEYMIPASTSNAAAGTAATAGTTVIRTACVERARKLILRDRTESWATGSNTRFTRTITFTSYQRDIDVPETVFRFQVPTGTFLDPGPLLPEEDSAAANETYRIGSGVSRPQLIQKVEPTWTEEARQAGVSGLVLVSLAVDADGNPRDLAVARGLGSGLDEKALDAVRQWRFAAGLKEGAPTAVRGLTVAVDFRLP